MNRNVDAGYDQQWPEHKGNNVVCAVYGVHSVCVVDVQDGEQAAQVVNTDGGDNKDNGHGFTSGGSGNCSSVHARTFAPFPCVGSPPH